VKKVVVKKVNLERSETANAQHNNNISVVAAYRWQQS
jgi:hypothetical protein